MGVPTSELLMALTWLLWISISLAVCASPLLMPQRRQTVVVVVWCGERETLCRFSLSLHTAYL